MPEFVVSFLGALNGNADVAIGNVVGSNIFNILGIAGVTALFFPIVIDKKNMKFEIPLCIAVSILLTILAFNFFNGTPATISRIDGLLLLAGFVLFIWYSFSRDRKNKMTIVVDAEETSPLWIAVIKVVGGLVLLITSCDLFVDNAVPIAKSFGVNDAFISLTLIACGTSLPELAASVAAAVKKNTDMALGNIIGSNIFNITLILGISSQVMPLTSSGITSTDYYVMIAAAILPLIIGLKGKIGRISGLLMILCFVIYNCYLVMNQLA
jgi:cation:H+ antiporter